LSGNRVTRLVAGAGVALAVALAGGLTGPGVASAHNAGRIELLVTHLQFTDGMGSERGVMVRADLIDRDSGGSAAGFAIVVNATGAGGAPAGPVTLTDRSGTGHYEGLLPVGPGSWTVTAKAEQGTSALPALGSTRTAAVEIDGSGAVTSGGSHGGGSHAELWAVLAAALLALAAGCFLVLRGPARGPAAAPPAGQRV
jgi:hypothetical protein